MDIKNIVMDIKNIVIAIQESNNKNKEAYFAKIYPEFKEKYPMFYKIACTTKMELANLDFMLAMLEKINTNLSTEFDASAEVGQMLFNKYVEPNLPEEPTKVV